MKHRIRIGGRVAAVAILATCLQQSDAHGADTGACVADIASVVARPATPEMTAAALPAELVTKLDAAARAALKEVSAPGIIAGVRTPQGTWTAAYGKADPKTGAPMEVGMHTRIGSITKTVTGTVLMQLAEAGKLSLDDPISKYVPGVPNGDKITLRLLANMTSGVASYTRDAKFTDLYFAKPETVFTPEQLLAIGLAASPVFPPGARFDYSNTNPILLGMAIEKVTEKPIADVIQTMVIERLNLKNTSWPGDSPEIPFPYAEGFTLPGDTAKPDAPSNATHWNPAWGWTAGEMISNMGDLLTYGRALGTGQGLLSPKMLAERLASFPGKQGYGLAIGCIDGWVGHTGELPGYNTTVFYDTLSDTTVIVQANSDIP